MPHLGSIKRKDLVYYLKQVSFEGPYSGGKHQFMIAVSQNNMDTSNVGV